MQHKGIIGTLGVRLILGHEICRGPMVGVGHSPSHLIGGQEAYHRYCTKSAGED